MADHDEKGLQASEVDGLEINPLSDEDLDAVAGGVSEGSCSCCQQASGCTSGKSSSPE